MNPYQEPKPNRWALFWSNKDNHVGAAFFIGWFVGGLQMLLIAKGWN